MVARQRKSAPGQPIASIGEKARDAVVRVEEKASEVLLVLWHELPSWQQDNHYILSGYRPASGSYGKSFSSLFYLHNESVNIYTHLLGALFFVSVGGFLYTVFAPRYATASVADIVVFGCFIAGVSLCLAMSATYHTICNHSPVVASFGNKLDYLGIVSSIWGSFIPSIYYGFYCDPKLQKIYFTMITTVGIGCAVACVMNRFRTPKWRPIRAGMFVAMGLSAIFPVFHGLSLYGYEAVEQNMGLSWVLLQGFFYILGAVLYASRFPERLAPGTFDIWGASHQIFHVLVDMAAASHLIGVLKAFDYHHGLGSDQC